MKATVAKTQSKKAGKPLVAIIKTATGLSKEFKISFKSKTTEKMNNDESLCKHTQSAELTSINTSAISSSDILSGKSRKHEQSTDSQETITDESSSETRATRTPKNLKQDTLKGFSEVQDGLGSGRYLESSESDYHSSDSEYICYLQSNNTQN